MKDIKLTKDVLDSLEKMKNCTDGWPWYWLSYGEECYAFAVVEAFTSKDDTEYPKPGSKLEPHSEKVNIWIGENGTEMLIESWIGTIEQQNGDTMCEFIARAHGLLLKDFISEITRDFKKNV